MGVKLTDGREVTFNYANVTRADFRAAVNPRGSLESEDVYLSKLTGLSVADIEGLSQADWQQVYTEALKQRNSIIPNSQSAST